MKIIAQIEVTPCPHHDREKIVGWLNEQIATIIQGIGKGGAYIRMDLRTCEAYLFEINQRTCVSGSDPMLAERPFKIFGVPVRVVISDMVDMDVYYDTPSDCVHIGPQPTGL